MATLLVIDDDPQVTLTITAAEPNWTIVQAADGLEGLDMLRQRLTTGNPPDLIVLDIGMPGLDGMDTLIQLRSLTTTIPIVVFTAMVHDCDLPRFMTEVGQVPIVYKGLHPAQLAEQLRSALGSTPVPVPPTAVLARLQHKVAELERQTRQQRVIRVALMVPARSTREGMRQLLEETGVQVAIAAPSAPIMHSALACGSVDVLMTVASEWRAMYASAEEYALPLLLLVISAEEGIHLLQSLQVSSVDQQISIVVDNDLAPTTLREVLRIVMRGEVYHDPLLFLQSAPPSEDQLDRLRLAVSDLDLTERDLMFLALELQDTPPETIAQMLGIKIESVYTARSRICRKADVAGIFELRQHIRAQLDYLNKIRTESIRSPMKP